MGSSRHVRATVDPPGSSMVFVIWLLVILLVIRIVLIGLFEPVMRKYLRDCKSVSRVKLDHSLHYLLGVLAKLYRETELTFQDQFMKVLQVLGLERHCSAKHSK